MKIITGSNGKKVLKVSKKELIALDQLMEKQQVTAPPGGEPPKGLREQVTEIREMVRRVAEGSASTEEDTKVYQMFGSLSKEQAQGLVIGVNFALNVLKG